MKLNSINPVAFRAITRGAARKAVEETSGNLNKMFTCMDIKKQSKNDRTCIIKSGEDYKVYGYDHGFIDGSTLYYCGKDFEIACKKANEAQTSQTSGEIESIIKDDKFNEEKFYNFITDYAIYPCNVLNFEPQELE